MNLAELKKIVVEGNKELPRRDLVKYSWGNVSGIDRENKLIVIKPVGIPYDELTVENVSVVDLDGKILEGPLNPSVDLDIHRALYEHFPKANAIVHTHSTYATVLAQLRRDLPCFGTTHADYFAGPVPCVGELTREEVEGKYEWNTGMAIVRWFEEHHVDPAEVPAALSPFHGPFTWGPNPFKAVENAAVLEVCAQMAGLMYGVNPDALGAPQCLMDKHYFRKHGAGAYYGQR